MELKRASFASVVLGLVGVSAFLAAEGVTSIVRAELEGPPLAPLRTAAAPAVVNPDHVASADVVLARNPFDAARGSLVPAVSKAGRAAAVLTPSDDPYAVPLCPDIRLAGSAEARDRGDSRATLAASAGHVLSSLREGDYVGDAQILLIKWDRVWFRGKTLCQATLNDPPPPPAPIASAPAPGATSAVRSKAPGEAEVDRGFLEQIRSDPSAVTKGTKARFDADGKGLLIADLKAGSPLAALGLLPGDRIESVNGFPLTNPEQALAAYAKLAVADRANVRLVRNGQSMQIDVAVK